MTKLVALHGYSMNGAVMRKSLDGLQRRLPALEIVAPDAPDPVPAESVDRLYTMWNEPRHPPPHWRWFDASDDGREYAGWDATRDLLATVLADCGGGRVGLVGFSQGAIVATAIAALAEHGEMPQVAFTILIGGRPPRADVLLPLLTRPLAVPSLHIWGEHDPLVGDAPAPLVELFAPATRHVVRWPGQHAIPTTPAALDAIVDFIGAS